jgi:uncharacterized membrane protein
MSASRWSLLLVAFALSPAAHAQTTFDTYRLTRIDAGVDVEISDMNEKGEMIGVAIIDPFLPRRPVLLRDGMLIDLGDPGAISPSAINDLTQITGGSFRPAGQFLQSFAFVWEGGQIRDLGIDATFGSIGTDINNRGQIVGFALVEVTGGGSAARAFLWEQGRTTILLEVFVCPSPATGSTVARAINENGVIVGSGSFPVPGRSFPFSHALIWQNGELMSLEPPLPMDIGEALDVNDRNEVIGFYYDACCSPSIVGFPNHTAFLWQPEGEVTVLPRLDRSPEPGLVPLRSVPESINNAGQIVGFTNFGDPDTDEEMAGLATLWQDGAVLDLNQLIRDDDPAKPFVTLLAGITITNSGVILASARDSREPESRFPDYFLLTPDGTSAPAASPSSPSSPSPSASDSGGGAVDLLSLLLLVLSLSSFARSQRGRCATPPAFDP